MHNFISPDNTEYEVQKLMKLKAIERSLATMLEAIDREINQTDVEWMRLKSLIQSKNTQSNTEMEEAKASVSTPILVEANLHMDDQTVNSTMINLSLENPGFQASSLDEEEDSD